MENQKQRLHEVSTRRCPCITKVVHWIGSEVLEPPRFDGLREVEEFIEEFEGHVPTELRTKALDIALKATPTRWWSPIRKHWDHGER